MNTGQELRHRHRRPSNPRTHSQHATSCRTSSAQSIPQNAFNLRSSFPLVSRSSLWPGRAGHARSLMEGLKGTAIRLAVRDPGSPLAPVLARARRLPALIRGCSSRWLRPRPPIPVRTEVLAEPGPACRPPARQARLVPGPGSSTRGPAPVMSAGHPAPDRTSQVLPVLVKTSPARIATGMDLAAGKPRGLPGEIKAPRADRRWLGTSPLGDVEGVEGGLPPVGPAFAAAAGGVQAHDRQVEALEGRVSSTGQRNTSMTEVLCERWRAACDSGRGAA